MSKSFITLKNRINFRISFVNDVMDSFPRFSPIYFYALGKLSGYRTVLEMIDKIHHD